MRHVSYAEALEAAVFEEMQRDSKVYYMGEDVGVFGGAITKTATEDTTNLQADPTVARQYPLARGVSISLLGG